MIAFSAFKEKKEKTVRTEIFLVKAPPNILCLRTKMNFKMCRKVASLDIRIAALNKANELFEKKKKKSKPQKYMLLRNPANGVKWVSLVVL